MPRTIKRKNKKQAGAAEPKDWLKAAPDDDIWPTTIPSGSKRRSTRWLAPLTPMEAQQRLAALYRARKEGTRPLDRP
ncbi:MAG: hypothetical protein L0Z46_12935 [Nitrospiraceae bacterium]|nr:hypothetical protein [Nitrospiraceae bacterium]